MANNSISLVSLDFDTLKSQLKTYLKSQSQFSDYDFDGSNMSVLLDILAYNTHLNAFYLNMIASEMFIDSAQLRNSIISIAKSLNYTPRSTKSSRAVINARFAQSGLQTFSIPKNTRFTSKNSRGTYQFLTAESLVLYPSNGFFYANNLSVYEGSLVIDTFVFNYATEGQRFILTNQTIDTDSLTVTVIEDNGQTNTVYTKATTLYGLGANNTVFFVQATEDTRYEVVFGDGTIGKKPKDGAIISCQYRNTVGTDGNECSTFVLTDNLGSVNGFGQAIIPTITTISSSFGGGPAETIEEIRYRAPRHYQAQERAITTNDYVTLVTREYEYIKNVYVFGGEEIVGTSQFGKIFIVPVTFTGELTSQTEKNEIQSFLKQRAAVGLDPVVVDPDYLYVGVDCEVKYDAAATSLSAADIETKVKNAISQYSVDKLTNFNTELKTSRLESAIDAADVSISSNDTSFLFRKLFRADTFTRTFPTVSYKNNIVPGTITSSEFISSARRYQYTDFNPNDNTFSVQQVGNQAVVTNSTNIVYLKDITTPSSVTYAPAGTVDYQNGILSLNAITVSSFEGRDGIDFYARPALEDVKSKNNDIIVIDPDNLTVTMKQI